MSKLRTYPKTQLAPARLLNPTAYGLFKPSSFWIGTKCEVAKRNRVFLEKLGFRQDPELLRAFWKAINEVTVLDLTCGSGAFLFAALNISRFTHYLIPFENMLFHFSILIPPL